ncbi:MAG TPA: restriction endonuclease [Methanothrix sp.]|nr:restriction endonuclease [Methanothrix sp.]HPJ84637.1 restriction endonuclease [Methanothrix sp.]HPR65856.1 restriction endonuclease [Methanothrix sp.]
MSPPGAGYSFEEDFADLIELNGYRVVKAARSDDGGSELIAIKTDEVGHQITYFIYCKKSGGPVDEADVERAAKAKEKHSGSVFVVVSPSAGFSRSAADLAERRGVRLWGPAEIDRLRRNVAEKRSHRQRESIESSDFREIGTKRKRGSKTKFVAMLLLLFIAFLYIKFYGFGTDPLQKLVIDLRDLVEGGGLSDLDLREVYESLVPKVRDISRLLSERVRGG